MGNDWESTFATWASPPSESEQNRCDNAVRAIRNALKESNKLKDRNITVFAQGSYKNRVNVRRDSDVDIGVSCSDIFYPVYPKGMSAADFGHPDGTYEYATYKTEIGEALTSHFGAESVTRGNKAFNVRENSYRVEADVAPFFEHRRYQDGRNYISGVELRPDNKPLERVINWPEQHYSNGVGKNDQTGRRYKALVRIIKSLRNRMDAESVVQAGPITGFLVECLVWNVPNENFSSNTYLRNTRSCLAFLFNNLRTDEKCSEWGEVSELKYLFKGGKKWTRNQAFSFIDTAWDYLGLE